MVPHSQLTEYLSVYLDELDEQLQIIDEQLLKLENHGDDMETVQTLFRAAHTLKGSSAAMGFVPIQQLTHCIENVFESIRNKQLSVDSELFSVLFQAVDYLKLLKHAVMKNQLDHTDIQPFLHALERIVKHKCRNGNDKNEIPLHTLQQERYSFNIYQKDAVARALHDRFSVYVIEARIRTDEMMKSARALVVYQMLQEQGDIIVSIPAIEDMEDETIFQGEMLFVLISREEQPLLQEKLNQLSQIESINMETVTLDNINLFWDDTELGAGIEKRDSTLPNAPVSHEAGAQTRRNQTVRVDVDRLEQLLNLVGELMIDQSRLQEVAKRFNEKYRDEPDVVFLSEISSHFNRVIGDLQDGMMKTRMLPIEHLFNRFPRMVRDVAQQVDKEIDFVLQGKDTELDRKLIEEISDPIIHILRNAIDHGIESPEERERQGKPRKGELILKAVHEENQIIISVTDDGRGIDPLQVRESSIRKGMITEAEATQMTDRELVHLIFRSGVSTANEVTELSGRGVGMDIVRAHIEKLNGVIDIETKPGQGTQFRIKLPLTLAILPSLLVQLGRRTFAIPLVNVLEIVWLQERDMKRVNGQEVCMIRGKVFPLVRMHGKLNISDEQNIDANPASKRNFVVMVGNADQQACLVVDRTIGNQEIVMKSLGSYIGDVPYMMGSTILGDGNVALILDIASILNEEGIRTFEENRQLTESAGEQEEQVVTFRLADQHYGVSIRQVKEIIDQPDISEVAHAPSHVLGMFYLRGTWIPVYDARSCLALSAAGTLRKQRVMIVETSCGIAGLLIDEVTGVLKISASDIQVEPQMISHQRSSFARGIYKNNNHPVTLLHIEAVIGLEYRVDPKEDILNEN